MSYPSARFSAILLGFVVVVAVRGWATPAREPIDFSHAGYGGGGVALPFVPARVAVAPSGADDTRTIQAALDEVGKLPVGADGFRGAVVLRPGIFRVEGTLRLASSGVVLRGNGATLLATGHSRRTLVEVRGQGERMVGEPSLIAGEAVAAGGTQLTLARGASVTVGSRIAVRRASSKEWILMLGMDRFAGYYKEMRLDWQAGSRDSAWTRTVVAADANTLTVDAPITCAIETGFGGGAVQLLSEGERLQHVGIEGLTLDSEFDASRPADEEHAWLGIQLDRVEDAWVRDLEARHLVSAAVWVSSDARRVTVQDCRSEKPVAENGGWRRLGFYVGGQQTLVLRCTADDARQAFALGHGATGPNALVDCTATHALADSGGFESWATGALFENVRIEGAGLVLGNLGEHNQGAGWSAGNSLLWNCKATGGVRAERAAHVENRAVTDLGTPSLYRAQLAARRGPGSLAALTHAVVREDGDAPGNIAGAAMVAEERRSEAAGAFAIKHGRFTVAGRVLFGPSLSNAWWKGQLVPARASGLGVSPTRWAPGRSGPGLTEDLDALTDLMRARGEVMFQAWSGLWYDRRRDEHLAVAREDGEVWGPFYEMPWARSGMGRAADGLSKYDLTRFNPWYWDRLHELAHQSAAKGLVVLHHFYNNHNLQENAAHWVEFPWRSANCLQETGFPEPPPFEEKGFVIHIADQFYDLTNPVRRDLHHRFIEHGLDVLADEPNVIHTLGFQFAGPPAFQEFFLDEVAAWQRSRGKRVHVALVTSKAVTDAMLADPGRAALVDVIDQRYWQYLADGSLFAPDGEGKVAFRELRMKAFGKDAVPVGTPELVYKQIREYRDRFPEKAVITSHAGGGAIPILMAGGALPLLGDSAAAQPYKPERDERALFKFVNEQLGEGLAQMSPRDDLATGGAWALADEARKTILIYAANGGEISLVKPLAVGTEASGIWFNPRTGETTPARVDLMTGTGIAKPTDEAWLLLVKAGKR